MRKVVVLLCVFVMMGVVSKAQTLSFQDSVKLTLNSSDTSIVDLYLTVTNTSSTDTAKVKWKRVLNDYDADWGGTQICDFNNCYTTATAAAPSDNFLAPGASKDFSVGFATNNNPGNGHVQLLIYLSTRGDSASSARIVDFSLKIDNATGIKQYSAESVKIFPNPARDYVLVQNQQSLQMDRIEVYSMLGRKVLNHKVDPSDGVARIDLSDLQKGIYMVRVLDQSNNVVLTKSISHIR